MSTTLEQTEADQQDIFDRLKADSFFVDIPVKLEAKGVTDADIAQALSTLNSVVDKIGVLAVVLMPTLKPDSPDAPGPRYVPRITIQVIDEPLFNLDATNGIGKTAARVAERVRMIIHRFKSRSGAEFGFAGQEPIAVEVGKNSYSVSFTRLAVDSTPPKVAEVVIAPLAAASPQLVTMTCVTPSAAIYYTTDGSNPSASNGTLYGGSFNQNTPATIRAVAQLANYQNSNFSQAIIS